ncbi:MAG: VPLPA-CTERM sorting domain-containing protein [Gammaproteobacteria bacterium]|nr:VPLPA-CTERM sorting domain-containing protein [Gammaproteobacteria bacterium]
MLWDGNGYNVSSDYTGPGSAANVTASSTQPFFGHIWTAHDIQVFLPGTYAFDVTLGGGVAESGTLTATVGPGQVGMHMLFDWNGGLNIDVFVVANTGAMFGAGLLYSTQTNAKGQYKCDAGFTGTLVKNCLYDMPIYGSGGQPVKNQVWMFASTDGDGDGVMGIPMVAGGPFAGFNANFNANLTAIPEVPIPAAAWLFGSGLMGLVATARRRKST